MLVFGVSSMQSANAVATSPVEGRGAFATDLGWRESVGVCRQVSKRKD